MPDRNITGADSDEEHADTYRGMWRDAARCKYDKLIEGQVDILASHSVQSTVDDSGVWVQGFLWVSREDLLEYMKETT